MGMNQKVRVRFAPSPTGALHIGGVRTALYNYLFARKMGGQMLLRIEDTDQTRFVPGAESYILDSLDWLGIRLDEGIREGGPHGPYRQSERKPIYKQYADQLVEQDKAYYAFDTPEELDAMRKRLEAAKVTNPQYNSITRTQMRNSLTLPAAEVKKRLDAGEPYVIRLKVPRKEEVRLNDLIRGWVVVHSSAIDDKVLMKSDGMPTYHLANIVDDHLMGITHVIRGEEWLPSAPLHVLLYRFLGWEDTMPQFVHLPLLLKPDGNGKLSKRDADAGGFPIFPLDWIDPATGALSKGFREAGYLPEALVNFLAFLGWNPGTTQELFTMEELIEAFSMDRIGKSGAKFDIQKANWYNQHYLRAQPDDQLAGYLIRELAEKQIACSQEKATKIIGLIKERLTFPAEALTEANLFFVRPTAYDSSVVSAKWTPEAAVVINDFKDSLAKVSTLDVETTKALIHAAAESKGVKLGKVMPALRIAVTGGSSGPDLMKAIEIMGKEELIIRIENALHALSNHVPS
jgi:glutamyl-tRNA synthetase